MLPELNSKIWGLHSKKLTIIGARTSQGKSALAVQMAWDVASQGIPVLFLSLEMYEEDVIERIFCMVNKINNLDLLTGQFKDKYQDKWKEFCDKVEGIPLVITDMMGKTWQEIDTYLNELTDKPKLIIIDHLQEAKDASLTNKKDIIDEYLKKMRMLAIRDNFSLVICSQINRSSQEDRKDTSPQLHQLKGSGYIEEGADIIILLDWPWHYSKQTDPTKKNRFIFNVAKNRNGRTGWIELEYYPEYYLFMDKAKEEDKEDKRSEKQADWEE